MKPVVIFATRSGNTKKVAEAIASELHCPCLRVTSDFTAGINDYGTVFIGTGIYKGQPHQDLLNYLQTTRLNGKKQFALFMTCFGWGKGVADKNVIDTLQGALHAKGQYMLDNRYSCFGGGLGFVKRGHPNTEELDGAKKWAKEIAIL